MKKHSFPYLVLIVASFLLLTFSSFLSAAEPINSTKEPVEIYHPFYIGVFGGWVIPDELEPDNGPSINLNQSWAVGAKAGYIFPFKWLAAEVEYMYLHDQDVDDPGTEHYKSNNLMANLILRYPYGMIRPYIGAGAGWSLGEIAGGSIDESFNNYAVQGIAGINLEIIPSLSIDFGYRYFFTECEIPGGDATLGDHILTLGLNYHFGGVKPVPPPPPPPPEPAPVVKKCSNVPSCCIVDIDGCPTDSDKDGVCDGCDKCPDTPSCCIVDENGCPKDSDKDGVCDGCDKCPDTPEGCAVDENGCPKDSDKDGVIDCRDKCPDTPAGVKVDKDGCPIPEIVEKGRTTLNVLFDFDKSAIKGNYSKDIDALADVMKKYEDLNVTIEGHTDNINMSKDPDYNKKLSQRRANSVKKYLVEKSGIDAKRLTAIGFGAGKPIDSNKTKEGRQKNRRVEAAVDYIIKK
ncbi:MAG: OmpA family protein [Smithella sp.]|jgi:OOP family OmpA-OmpF porin